MKYYLRNEKTKEKLFDVTFKSKHQVDKWIDSYLMRNGLDWRVGYLFKSRLDDFVVEVVVAKTGELLKHK